MQEGLERPGKDAISKNGLLKLLTTGLGVPKDLALKVFPELAKLLSRGTDTFERMHRDASKSNTDSQKAAQDHEKFVAEVYAEQLRLESLTPEERESLNEKLEAGAKRAFAKDSENKEFIQGLLKLAAAGVISALAIALVVLNERSDGNAAES